MNVVEQQLCKRLADLLQERLPGVSIDGNWCPSATTPKGADIWRGAKLDVTVGTRSYGEFTSLTAEMEVRLEGEFPVAADPTLDRSVAAYAAVVALIEEWHGSIAAVKRDLTIGSEGVEECGSEGVNSPTPSLTHSPTPSLTHSPTLFDPVGLRLSGGTFELDRDTKVRYYSQTFAVRGRIFNTGTRSPGDTKPESTGASLQPPNASEPSRL